MCIDVLSGSRWRDGPFLPRHGEEYAPENARYGPMTKVNEVESTPRGFGRVREPNRLHGRSISQFIQQELDMGRAALVLVIGFSTALLVIGSNISSVSSQGMENYMFFHSASVAHAIAGSGINLASRSIYEDRVWRGGFANKAFSGGAFTCTLTDLPFDRVRMTSSATYHGVTRVVSCLLQPSSFSRYAYYSTTDMSGYWITGDTCWGPFHCNNTLNAAGTPVFMGRATCLNGLNKYDAATHPVFKGGYDQGINVTLPADLNPLKNAANIGGKYFTAGGKVFIEFLSNGQVSWRTGGPDDWSGGGWTVEDLTTFAPNGAIWSQNNDVRIKGVVNGRVTVGSNKDIWIDSDVVYAADPRVGPSDDLLGLVAEKKLWITDNADNNGPGNNFTLMASVFSRTDGLWAEHYNSRGVEGKMTTVGGLIQKIGGYTGVFSGSPPVVVQGFEPGGAVYDLRLMNDAPPFFPTTGNYEVVSWFE